MEEQILLSLLCSGYIEYHLYPFARTLGLQIPHPISKIGFDLHLHWIYCRASHAFY